MAFPLTHPISHQLIKTFFSALALIRATVYISPFLIYYLPSNLRQHPQWTYHQALRNGLLQTWWDRGSSTKDITSPSRSQVENQLVLEPTSQTLYDSVSSDPDIQPAAVEVTWFPRLYEPGIELWKTIVLHFSGGNHIPIDSRDYERRYNIDTLVENLSATVITPTYRQMPLGAIQDAITTYRYLLDQGISPARIVLSGDSEGAHLLLSFLQRISGQEERLPRPVAALLWSPWLRGTEECEISLNREEGSHHVNASVDYLTLAPPRAVTSVFGPTDSAFSTKTPLWIQLGGAEVLHDDGVAFANKMRAVEGNTVEVHEVPHVSHDILLMGRLLGFQQEATDAAQNTRRFLTAHGVTEIKRPQITGNSCIDEIFMRD